MRSSKGVQRFSARGFGCALFYMHFFSREKFFQKNFLIFTTGRTFWSFYGCKGQITRI
ncbi:MAG: hypothetical protein IJ112_05325 [Oscillospiraceae bacterium]|nr:hypothetical protein [Oscillospiraceae bacterium]